MKLPANSLKILVKEVYDPKNPFGPLFPQPPKPTPITPKGPYVPTPGGVKPKNPKVVTPKLAKAPESLWKGFAPAVLGGKNQKEVAKKTENLMGSVGDLYKMTSDIAKGAGAFAATPPRERMASLTGRLGGLGYTNKGIEDRMRYYRAAIGGINPLSWMAGALGGVAGKATGAVSGSLLGGVADLAQQWATATTDEPAKILTAALYDPRALSKLQ
jgi:hypothetical protein